MKLKLKLFTIWHICSIRHVYNICENRSVCVSRVLPSVLWRFWKCIACLILTYLSTYNIHRVPKKYTRWCWQMWTDFQNSFTWWFVRKFSMKCHKDFHFTCNMLLHYLVKVENLKMLLTLTAPQQTVDMFMRTLWGLDLTFNSS